MLNASKLFANPPDAGYCPGNPDKGHSHNFHDWSYWARSEEEQKHPVCGVCRYVDTSRILDSWKRNLDFEK